jgi:hypothetical protein
MGQLLAASAGGVALLIPLYIIIYIVFSLGVYGSYKKAGQYGDPAWSAFIPIYSFYVMLKIAGRPTWWTWFVLLPIIPFLGSLAFLVIAIIVLHDVSKSFGHGGGFTVGLVLLSIIFWYILWLGSSQYRGPAGPLGAGGPSGGGYIPEPGYPSQPGYPPPSQPGWTPPSAPAYPPPPGQIPPPPGQVPPPQ